jgi:hydrogenase/urease accessory protein HupE
MTKYAMLPILPVASCRARRPRSHWHVHHRYTGGGRRASVLYSAPMSHWYPLPYSLLLVVFLRGSSPVWAHEPGLSVADLHWTDQRLTAHLTFARREIDLRVPVDADQDGVVTAAEFAAAYPQLYALARQLLTVSIDGQQLSAEVAAVELDQSDALHVQLSFPRQDGTQLRVHAPVITALARGHRQYVSVRNAQRTLVAERMLDADHAMFDLSLRAMASTAQTLQSFRQFLRLGVEHILTGYDHLLFLFGLLIIGGSFWSACRIISAFTVAHSITLALATLEVVRLPSRLVEPLIAVSIVYVGLENLWRREVRQRWRLTFGFGLIHGLGFASVLRGLGIGGSAAIVPLLAFNGGVELGQLAVALLVLPLLWRAQHFPQFFPHFATVCSLLIALAGLYWLLERTLFF